MTGGARRVFKEPHRLWVPIQQCLAPPGSAIGYAKTLQQLLDAVALPRLRGQKLHQPRHKRLLIEG